MVALAPADLDGWLYRYVVLEIAGGYALREPCP